jgi:ATP/maltotriose-dependent transcriptional regulator MalT
METEHNLTPRELTVLTHLGSGLAARTIAQHIGVSTHTVNKHLENLYRKLGTSDRLTTVLHAQSLGLLHFPSPDGPHSPRSRLQDDELLPQEQITDN